MSFSKVQTRLSCLLCVYIKHTKSTPLRTIHSSRLDQLQVDIFHWVDMKMTLLNETLYDPSLQSSVQRWLSYFKKLQRDFVFVHFIYPALHFALDLICWRSKNKKGYFMMNVLYRNPLLWGRSSIWTKKCSSLHRTGVTLRLLKIMLFTPLLVMHWSGSSSGTLLIKHQRLSFGLTAMLVLSQF